MDFHSNRLYSLVVKISILESEFMLEVMTHTKYLLTSSIQLSRSIMGMHQEPLMKVTWMQDSLRHLSLILKMRSILSALGSELEGTLRTTH